MKMTAACMHHLWLAVSWSTVPACISHFKRGLTCCTIAHSVIDQERELENAPLLRGDDGDGNDVCMYVLELIAL